MLYSTKTDINYVNYQDRQKMQPVPKEFDMFGLTNLLQWKTFLTLESTVRTALTYNSITEIAQRKNKLSQVKRGELLYQMRQFRDADADDTLFADFLTVQVSDGNGTIYEQTAVCAAVVRSDLELIRERVW